MTALAERLSQPDVADLPDWAAAEALNAPDATLPKTRAPVNIGVVVNQLRQIGVWYAIRAAAADGVLPAIAAVDLHQDPRTTAIEFDLPIVVQMLAGLVQAGLLTQEQVDALSTLADREQSWAQANGVAVDARAVGLARGAL